MERRLRDLERVVGGSDWRPAGAPTTFLYDPPWTLPFFRRDEVVVPVVER